MANQNESTPYMVRVIVLRGSKRREFADKLQRQNNDLELLMLREWADAVAERAEEKSPEATQDADASKKASLGTVSFMEQILAEMPDGANVMILDLANEGELEALKDQFGDDLLVIDSDQLSLEKAQRQIEDFITDEA